ncbi:hypothetical protein [Fibrobacter sp. UWH5]|uniref:hypothetical protein n=1 Tax=Fibrobacter sp. UWH5 TaxID=1896211 RepID=UPI000935352E|nr:hypothetical protein [Fibrobacter sp. UWH5]
MGIDELEKFCAENGVSFTELQSWRDLSLSAMENSGDGNVMSVKQHEDEVAKLKAELARKEKALAEAAALLILQKNFGNFGTGKVAEPKKLEILAAIEEATGYRCGMPERRARKEGIPADAAGRCLPDERRHRETRGGMRLQALLEPSRRHRRIHEVVQERQESVEVGLLLDAGRKMPTGSPARPREIFFKKMRRGY